MLCNHIIAIVAVLITVTHLAFALTRIRFFDFSVYTLHFALSF